jgi:hypothetical protein
MAFSCNAGNWALMGPVARKMAVNMAAAICFIDGEVVFI